MNKVLKEGYTPVLGARALATLNRDLGHGIAGMKNKYDAIMDYQPGASDDMSKGFHIGSHIVNEKKEAFLCVDDTEGKAVWIKIQGTVTPSSYDSTKEANAPEPEAKRIVLEEAGDLSKEQFETLKSHEGKPRPTAKASVTPKAKPTEQVDAESGNFQFGAEGGPNRGKTAIPDDMPWQKYLLQAGLNHIEDVAKKLEDGSLVDVKYFNESRVADVKAYLQPVEA